MQTPTEQDMPLQDLTSTTPASSFNASTAGIFDASSSKNYSNTSSGRIPAMSQGQEGPTSNGNDPGLIDWNEKPYLKQVTLRGTVVGLFIGSLVLISNFQFGLQTGWVSMMSLGSALLACAIFKQVMPYIIPKSMSKTPFTDVENVYIQSIAVAVGTGPLCFGFVGVVPAIEKFLTVEEAGGIDFKGSISLFKLLVWSTSLAFFGVFFAVPLRKQVIIKEKLPFPSGSATATLIGVLNNSEIIHEVSRKELNRLREYSEVLETEMENASSPHDHYHHQHFSESEIPASGFEGKSTKKLSKVYYENIKILVKTFAVSSIYTIGSYFLPILKELPVFGNYLSKNYLWNFQPSPAYIGQGIIMGLPTTSYMMFGAILGWAILGPLCKKLRLVDPDADVHDWQNGIQGWVLWCSLTVMVVDSCIGFIVVTVKSLIKYYYENKRKPAVNIERVQVPLLAASNDTQEGAETQADDYGSLSEGSDALDDGLSEDESANVASPRALVASESQDNLNNNKPVKMNRSGSSVMYVSKDFDHDVKDPSLLVGQVTVISGIIISAFVCIFSMIYIYGMAIVPIYSVIWALVLALFLSILAVRALGETDLNPVSGIGKLSQLIFAVITPKERGGAVLLNLVAGAIAEAGAQQAGDLMQDLKTGHLLGASPKAQFIAQMIGASWSIVLSSVMYKVYNKVYTIPSANFRVPTAVIWIDCARLVMGHGLPKGAGTACLVLGIVFGLISFVKNIYRDHPNLSNRFSKFLLFLPSGVAVGVGIYNSPSFTIARFIGGLAAFIYVKSKHANRTKLIVFSSGLVLGEGICSIFNMIFSSLNVPHM